MRQQPSQRNAHAAISRRCRCPRCAAASGELAPVTLTRTCTVTEELNRTTFIAISSSDMAARQSDHDMHITKVSIMAHVGRIQASSVRAFRGTTSDRKLKLELEMNDHIRQQ